MLLRDTLLKNQLQAADEFVGFFFAYFTGIELAYGTHPIQI
jgi:hypothetical protein